MKLEFIKLKKKSNSLFILLELLFILFLVILPFIISFFLTSYVLFALSFAFLLLIFFIKSVLDCYRKIENFPRKGKKSKEEKHTKGKKKYSKKELRMGLLIFSFTISIALIFIISLSFPILIKSTGLSTGWIRIWGEENKDLGRGIAIDSNDNIYITGLTLNHGEEGLFLIKYDIFGNEVWSKTWGNHGSESGYRVALDSSENIYILGGTYNRSNMDYDIVLIKFTSEGDLIWNRTWDGGKDDDGNCIIIDSQNNIYIGGSKGGDILLLKYDSSGTYLWNKTRKSQESNSSALCNGLGINSEKYIFLGCTVKENRSDMMLGNTDIIMLKYDSDGNYNWNITLEDISSSWCNGLVIDTTDNIFLLGESHNFATLVQFDKNGNLNWNRSWQGVSAFDMKISRNNNIFIGGWAHNPGTSSDFLYIKVNSLGELEAYGTWFKDSYDLGRGIAVDSNENVYIIGYTDNSELGNGEDVCLIKNPFFSVDIRLFFFIFMELLLAGIIIIFDKKQTTLKVDEVKTINEKPKDDFKKNDEE